jgi:hypothetical protein
MTLPSVIVETPAHQNNVRVVAVDDRHQPLYLRRAGELEAALLRTAAALGLEAEDMPGLRGLCVEGVRAAETRGR